MTPVLNLLYVKFHDNRGRFNYIKIEKLVTNLCFSQYNYSLQ